MFSLSLFASGEGLDTLPQTLQDELIRSLIEGTNGSWERRVKGGNYTLTRYTDFQDGYGRDNRELYIEISPFHVNGGKYFQAVRILTDLETGIKSCFLERRIDIGGQCLAISQNMNYGHGIQEGEPSLGVLMDTVLDPFLGFMQMPVEYVQRLALAG